MLKFLADENVAHQVVEVLRKEKFDVLSVYEKEISGVSKESISPECNFSFNSIFEKDQNK